MDPNQNEPVQVDFVQVIMKYLILGGSVALVVSILPKSKMNSQEVIGLALTASVVFLILDTYAPSISIGARQGAGFGIGSQLVGGLGFGGAMAVSGKEGFVSENENDLAYGNRNGNFETNLNGNSSESNQYKAANASHLKKGFRDNMLKSLNDNALSNEKYRQELSHTDFDPMVTSKDFHPTINSVNYALGNDLDRTFLKPDSNEGIEGFSENYKSERMSRLNKAGAVGTVKNGLLAASH